MTPKQRVRMKVHPSTDGPEDVIIHANAQLSVGRSREAIELYTEVLYNKAPGHIIAFLNRSLAYMLDRRPELAATDAYRACISTHDIRGSDLAKTRQRLLEVRRYLRAEKLEFHARREWTRPDRRIIPYQPGAWTSRPLASIFMDEDGCPMSADCQAEELHMRLEVRALFRLCGALFSCKGGASQDALGLISDAMLTCKMTLPEKHCFYELGNGIVQTVSDISDFYKEHGQDTADEHTTVIPIGGSNVPKTKPMSMMKTRVTMAPAVQYWADTYEPDFAKRSTHKKLEEYTFAASETCDPAVIDRSSVHLMPGIQMRAKVDHLPGDTLIYDRSAWHVSTSCPNKLLMDCKRTKGGCMRLYCDTCATALLMPQELVQTLLNPSGPRKVSAAAATGSSNRVAKDPEKEDETQKERRRWCMATQVSFCHPRQHRAVYCSKTCRRDRRLFDSGLHEDINIEHDFRTEKFPTNDPPLENVAPAHPHSLYCHSKVQTLYDLLFLRIYVSALNEDKHPLELVRFLPGKLSPASALPSNPPAEDQLPAQSGDKRVWESPWSFTNNIVKPIWCINRYHTAVAQDPFHHLRQSDGWVINTLLAKIQVSTEISRGAKSAIIYNLDEGSKSYCYRGLEPWVSDKFDTVYETEEDFDEVWVGLLDPVLSMVKVADEAKGEKPNCWLKYDEGVMVIAGQPEDSPNKIDVAIRKGEVLLRAKPAFLGGSPYEVRKYTQRDPGPPSNRKKAETAAKNADATDESMTNLPTDGADSHSSNRVTVYETDDNTRTSSAEVEDMLQDMPDDISSEDPDSIVSSMSPELPTLLRDSPMEGSTCPPAPESITPDLSSRMESMMGKNMAEGDDGWEYMDVETESPEKVPTTSQFPPLP